MPFIFNIISAGIAFLLGCPSVRLSWDQKYGNGSTFGHQFWPEYMDINEIEVDTRGHGHRSRSLGQKSDLQFILRSCWQVRFTQVKVKGHLDRGQRSRSAYGPRNLQMGARQCQVAALKWSSHFSLYVILSFSTHEIDFPKTHTLNNVTVSGHVKYEMSSFAVKIARASARSMRIHDLRVPG